MAAEMLGMHPQTLRKYERLGLIQPSRTIGSMRLYSREELERLRFIKHLVDEAGVNLAGVQRLLSIVEVMDRIRPLMDESALSTGGRAPAALERNPPAERGTGDYETMTVAWCLVLRAWLELALGPWTPSTTKHEAQSTKH